MTLYVIAVNRERRSGVPADWIKRLGRIDGVEFQGAGNPYRVQVNASDDAIEKVRQRFGDLCHIEAAIPHRFV